MCSTCVYIYDFACFIPGSCQNVFYDDTLYRTETSHTNTIFIFHTLSIAKPRFIDVYTKRQVSYFILWPLPNNVSYICIKVNHCVHQWIWHTLKKSARPLGQKRGRSSVYLAFLEPIAMAKRILPGTFCLEPCRLNLPQATPKVTRNW